MRVRRLVRRIELWPVAKVAFFFHILCYLLTLAVLVLLWVANDRLGTKDKLEKAFQSSGFGKDFTINGDMLLRIVASAGAVLVVVATIATVALAFFYNGISMIFGGLVVSFVEERRPVVADVLRLDDADATGQLPEGMAGATAGTIEGERERRRGERRARRGGKGRRGDDRASDGVDQASAANWSAPVGAGHERYSDAVADPLAAPQEADVAEEWLDEGDWAPPPTWLETSVAEERSSA